jgi:hypothetical protein
MLSAEVLTQGTSCLTINLTFIFFLSALKIIFNELLAGQTGTLQISLLSLF